MSNKDKIKQMLCDAICMLCQNTVQHNAQLSIEALIGITVDNGADIVLVSIKELLEKSDSVFHAVSGSSKKEPDASIVSAASINSNASQEDQYCEEDCFTVEDDCVEFSPSDSFSRQLVKQETTTKRNTASMNSNRTNTVVKVEEDDFMVNYDRQQQYSRQRSSVDRNYCDAVHSDQADAVAFASENWEDNSFVSSDVDFPDRNADSFGEQSYDNLGNSLSTDSAVAIVSRPTSIWRGVHKSSPSIRHTLFRKKQKQISSAVRAATKTNVDWSQPATAPVSALPEVTHLTLYSCTLCGAQMSRLDSFKRHKRTHMALEQPRCDVCGKAFSRADNMQAHRRRCAVNMQYKRMA